MIIKIKKYFHPIQTLVIEVKVEYKNNAVNHSNLIYRLKEPLLFSLIQQYRPYNYRIQLFKGEMS
jgi:hypothetical protein